MMYQQKKETGTDATKQALKWNPQAKRKARILQYHGVDREKKRREEDDQDGLEHS